jgi:hypothetical protein
MYSVMYIPFSVEERPEGTRTITDLSRQTSKNHWKCKCFGFHKFLQQAQNTFTSLHLSFGIPFWLHTIKCQRDGNNSIIKDFILGS